MQLRDELIFRLQQMLSVKEELNDYVEVWADRVRDAELAGHLNEALPEFTGLIGNLLRCLKTLDASSIDSTPTTALVAAFAYDDVNGMEEDTPPSPARDVHFVANALAIGAMEIALYSSMIDMARRLDLPEVQQLLRENLAHNQRDEERMRGVLARLLEQAGEESAAA